MVKDREQDSEAPESMNVDLYGFHGLGLIVDTKSPVLFTVYCRDLAGTQPRTLRGIFLPIFTWQPNGAQGWLDQGRIDAMKQLDSILDQRNWLHQDLVAVADKLDTILTNGKLQHIRTDRDRLKQSGSNWLWVTISPPPKPKKATAPDLSEFRLDKSLRGQARTVRFALVPTPAPRPPPDSWASFRKSAGRDVRAVLTWMS